MQMCGGALYVVPIVVFSVIYNLSKFYEVQTVPGFYEFPNSTVSTVLLNELCTVPYRRKGNGGQ